MPLPGPDTHVVELRVPGLIGTDGESVLDSVGTVDVAGDGIGRIIRPSDRLHRPAPGPVLHTLGRPVPRTLEGYLWNRMTWGGARKAAWALLFPFSLVNVARWMLPPTPANSVFGSALAAVCRALLRVSGLLLTMLLLSQLAVVSLDLIATQCLSPDAACSAGMPDWFRRSRIARIAVGVVPLLLAVLVLYRVSSARWSPNISGGTGPDGQPPGPEPEGELPGDGVDEDLTETTMLRCLHTVAASAVIAVLLTGGPNDPPGHSAGVVVWMTALTLAGFSVGASAVHTRRLLGRAVRVVLLALALGSVAAALVFRDPSAPLPSRATADTVELLGTALFAMCWLFAVLLVPMALSGRATWSTLPTRLRPWAGGWAAAPVVALAALLGGGFGAGLAIAARQLLGADLRLPEGYELITLLWGAGLALSAALALFCVGVAIPFRKARRGIPEVLELMGIRGENRRQAADAWARASWERKYLHRLVLGIALALGAGATVLVSFQLNGVGIPAVLDPLAAVGVVGLGALAAALLRAVYTAATGTPGSRHLAAFADLVCFWPRAVHPAVPPSYARKAVPELADRAREHLGEADRRVVLAGYHIGGLLAVLAGSRLVAELSGSDRERLGLLTAGAPLQWGYQRAFPAVFGPESLARLYGSLDGRWRGLCRGTDTFGGGATTWSHQVNDDALLAVGYVPDGGVGALRPAVPGQRGVLVLGGDHWLPDPMSGPEKGRRWVAGVLRHADYVADPEWDHAVGLAAGLEGPPARESQPEEPPSGPVAAAGELSDTGSPGDDAVPGDRTYR